MRSRKKEEAGPEHQWIVNPWTLCTELSEAETAKAAEKATEELLRDCKGATDRTPHAIFTVGAPGSGKTHIAPQVVRLFGQAPAESYVTLDHDLLIRFHPNFRNILRVPDVFGHPTPVGFSQGFRACISNLESLGDLINNRLLERHCNAVIHTHSHEDILQAVNEGYSITLVYVAAPLELAKERARRRAVETGFFLAPTLAAQDNHIERRWHYYRYKVPYAGIGCDLVLVVANDQDGELPKRDDFIQIVPSGHWRLTFNAIRRAINQAHHDVNPERQSPSSEVNYLVR